jgi:hypothetical protein
VNSASEVDAAVSQRATFKAWQRWGLLAAFALLVILRLPHAWAHGRFQDEEATVFLAYAWHYPWLDALFRPFGGYWNLAANGTTLLAVELVRSGMLPLERAPYLTMSIALGFQLLPALLILTNRASWLAGRLPVIAALLLIASAPATEEVFFNALHIQFHLALCVALILALDVPERRAVRFGYGVILFLAPLCGPGAIVFLPLFALRALIDRDRGRLAQLAILTAGAAVQLLLFYGPSPIRGHMNNPVTIAAAMFVRLLVLPLLGVEFAYRVGDMIYASQASGGIGWWLSGAAALLAFVGLTVLALQRRDSAIWLVLSSLSVAVASLGFGMASINPRDPYSAFEGERYNFLPIVLLGLALVALSMRSGFRGSRVCAFLCGLMLFTGAVHFTQPLQLFAEGPSWQAEVKAWRNDHRHPLAVWPRPWAADLSDEARPCSPLPRDPRRSTDPRYCESGWVAGFYRGQK